MQLLVLCNRNMFLKKERREIVFFTCIINHFDNRTRPIATPHDGVGTLLPYHRHSHGKTANEFEVSISFTTT